MKTIQEIKNKYLPNITNRHIDLGCGANPRNPFSSTIVFGCDINDYKDSLTKNFEFIQADLSNGSIASKDNYFDSVSAFDFFEHVARQEKDRNGNTKFPFIELMNEIYRILVPNGILVSSTPAYPSPLAFQDPTHVNIITENTHNYFCDGDLYAQRYGFKGKFRCIFAGWNSAKNLERPNENKYRQAYRNLEYKLFKGGHTHITWVLQAVK